MIRLIIFFSLLFLSTLAWGDQLVGPERLTVQTITFRWVPPTTREDGSPLSPEEIAGYWLYCSQSRQGPFEREVDISVNVNQYTYHGTSSYCKLSAYDTDGRESKLSAASAGRPAPPTRSIFEW